MSVVLVANIVFAVLVTGVMATMKIPIHGARHLLIHNPSIWLYFGHWIKTIAMSARIVLWETDAVDPNIITLCFCSFGCLIVCMSAISPVQLLYHYHAKQQLTALKNNRFQFCLAIVFAYSCALAASLVVGIRDNHRLLKTVLNIWRACFFVGCTLEVGVLVGCVWLVHQASKTSRQQQMMRGMQVNFLVTLYMRIGVAGSVVLKILGHFERGTTDILHLWFMLSGMLGFFYMYRSRRGKQIIVTSTPSQQRKGAPMFLWPHDKQIRLTPSPKPSHFMTCTDKHSCTKLSNSAHLSDVTEVEAGTSSAHNPSPLKC